MQTSLDLICTECNDQFDSASLLLQHFAKHAIKHLQTEITSMKTYVDKKKNKIPNLYPINMNCNIDICANEVDRGSDSGIEDVNPLKFCMVTMEGKQKIKSKVNNKHENVINASSKRYQCTYCSRRFGWSTDLKRHILIHTGERPFQCLECNASFTRNFLLQKHQKKIHTFHRSDEKLPELRPISEVLNIKRRKQHKLLIERNITSLDNCLSNYFDHKLNGLLCSS